MRTISISSLNISKEEIHIQEREVAMRSNQKYDIYLRTHKKIYCSSSKPIASHTEFTYAIHRSISYFSKLIFETLNKSSNCPTVQKVNIILWNDDIA